MRTECALNIWWLSPFQYFWTSIRFFGFWPHSEFFDHFWFLTKVYSFRLILKNGTNLEKPVQISKGSGPNRRENENCQYRYAYWTGWFYSHNLVSQYWPIHLMCDGGTVRKNGLILNQIKDLNMLSQTAMLTSFSWSLKHKVLKRRQS